MEKLTREEMTFLSGHADNIARALDSNYCRNVGAADLDRMNKIWERITGQPHHLNPSCGACILDLLQRVGQAWRTQSAEGRKNRTAAATAARKNKNAKK